MIREALGEAPDFQRRRLLLLMSGGGRKEGFELLRRQGLGWEKSAASKALRRYSRRLEPWVEARLLTGPDAGAEKAYWEVFLAITRGWHEEERLPPRRVFLSWLLRRINELDSRLRQQITRELS